MPVALEDILINFDDEAASDTFQVLAEISQKTQVIYCLHHQHLWGQAIETMGKESFTAHRL